MSETAEFEKNWDSFTHSVKARFDSEKGTLSYSICTLLLNDEKACWTSEDSSCGKWLADLRSSDPVKADLILSIIMNDVKLREPEKQSAVSLEDILFCCIIPLAAAYAAFGVCKLLKTSNLVTLIAELVLELVLVIFLIPKRLRKSASSPADMYLSQLDKFKGVISGILANDLGGM